MLLRAGLYMSTWVRPSVFGRTYSKIVGCRIGPWMSPKSMQRQNGHSEPSMETGRYEPIGKNRLKHLALAVFLNLDWT